MSLTTALYTRLGQYSALSSLVGTRIYPVRAAASAALPYVVQDLVSVAHPRDQGGATGLIQSRVQVSCYGSSYGSAQSVGEAVRDALDTYQGTVESVDIRKVTLVDRADDYVPAFDGSEAGYYRRRMDFLIWHVESAPAL